MPKNAKYTISVRLSKETLSKLEKYQEEHHLTSRSECLQQAVDLLLSPENREENRTKMAIQEALNDPEIQTTIEEISWRVFENTTLTLKKR